MWYLAHHFFSALLFVYFITHYWGLPFPSVRKTLWNPCIIIDPPGAPYIEGYQPGETLRRGQNVELVCRSRGGNPPAQLIWYKNGVQVRMAYRFVCHSFFFFLLYFIMWLIYPKIKHYSAGEITKTLVPEHSTFADCLNLGVLR